MVMKNETSVERSLPFLFFLFFHEDISKTFLNYK